MPAIQGEFGLGVVETFGLSTPSWQATQFLTTGIGVIEREIRVVSPMTVHAGGRLKRVVAAAVARLTGQGRAVISDDMPVKGETPVRHGRILKRRQIGVEIAALMVRMASLAAAGLRRRAGCRAGHWRRNVLGQCRRGTLRSAQR